MSSTALRAQSAQSHVELTLCQTPGEAPRQFTPLYDDVMIRADLSLTEKVVLCFLRRQINPAAGRFECRPCQTTISRKLGISLRTVERSISSLLLKNAIRSSRKSRHQSNRYEILPTPLTRQDGGSGTRQDGGSGPAIMAAGRDKKERDKKERDKTTRASSARIDISILSGHPEGKLKMGRRPKTSDFDLRPASEMFSNDHVDLEDFVLGKRAAIPEGKRSILVAQLVEDTDLQRTWFRKGPGLLKRIRKAADVEVEDWTPEQLWSYWRLLLRLSWPDTGISISKKSKHTEIGCVGKAMKRFGPEIAKRLLESLVVRWRDVKRENKWLDLERPSVSLASGEKMGPTLVSQFKLDRSGSVTEKLSGGADPLEQLRARKARRQS